MNFRKEKACDGKQSNSRLSGRRGMSSLWHLWKRKQMKVSLMGFEHVVSCLCECEVKARQELDEKMQREEEQRQLYQRKSVGLRERRFWEWKFENDNGSNQKILIARQYVENWTDMKRKNVGLLLMGPVGTGKSFFAGCICKCTFGTGRTCHDDKLFQDFK